MTWTIRTIATIALTSFLTIRPAAQAWAADSVPSVEEYGKSLAFSRQKGNCLSCHNIDDGELPGDLGPSLIDLQARYKDREALRSYIWDATLTKPETTMPPFGRHRILTDEEINAIVEYLWTL